MASPAPKRPRTKTSGPQVLQDVPAPSLQSEKARNVYQKLKKQPLAVEHKVDLDFFRGTILDVSEMFGAMNWLKLLNFAKEFDITHYFPNEILEFYANLDEKVTLDGKVASTVKGMKIEFSSSDLNRWLGLDDSAEYYSMSTSIEGHLGRLLGPEGQSAKTPIPGGKMTFLQRLVHIIVVRTLLPRGGNYSSGTRDDIYMISMILHREFVNLGRMIVFSMGSVVPRRKNPSHALVLTLIFKRLRVPLSNDEGIKYEEDKYTIGKNKTDLWSLRKMSDGTGSWFQFHHGDRSGRRLRAEDKVTLEEAAPDPAPAPDPPNTGNPTLLLSAVPLNAVSLSDRIETLERRVTEFQQDFINFKREIRQDVRKGFKKLGKQLHALIALAVPSDSDSDDDSDAPGTTSGAGPC